jgi:hypothetical protein
MGTRRVALVLGVVLVQSSAQLTAGTPAATRTPNG